MPVFGHPNTCLIPILTALCISPGQSTAQSLNTQLTDPAAIAAECGGDPNLGKPHFAACAECHALRPEQATGRGPHLAELYGRMAGGVPDYPYSPMLSETPVMWEGDSLHRLLSGEMGVPGHPVIADEQTRRDLLTWLRIETRPAPPAPEDVAVPAALLAMEGDAAWGEYLSGDCMACHAPGSHSGPLAGMDRDGFITAMVRFRARAMGSDTMQLQAQRLSDEEIAALAAYFEAQK